MTVLPVVSDYHKEMMRNKVRRTLKQIVYLMKTHVLSMFPILQWMSRYNLNWLIQDMIAGITVGIVIVPQGMAYAKLANLDPQYGLYTSFVGVTIYCLFGTSKDISMGPISTVSLLFGSIVNTVMKANPDIDPSEIAVTISLFAGIVMCLFSLFRLGILVDFIPEPAISGFMTGSAITIVLSQWPKLFGISSVTTHEPPYLVFVNTLANLSSTQLDVAFGLSSLVFLYGVRYMCERATLKSKTLQKSLFLFNMMRNGLIVIIGTCITFFMYRNHDMIPISVIQTVPAGFDSMGIPYLRFDILYEASSMLPPVLILLILEHVSVAKTFGRINGYQIAPDQEILAIGVSNLVSSFFGGFLTTGAFSRTAIMARSGVKTPLSGVFSGVVIVLALYILTPAFYYIPDAVLAAVVIHAVSGLVSSGQFVKELWQDNFLEFVVWASAVIITIFVDVEVGIYVSVGLSLVILLLRLARPNVQILARISVSLLNHQHETTSNTMPGSQKERYIYVDEKDLSFEDYVDQLPAGILVLRPCDSILYPNAEHISEAIVKAVKRKTRCANTIELQKSSSDRPWNCKAGDMMESLSEHLPVLQAIIFDFSAVRRLDATAQQLLITTRDTIDKYAGCTVEWHFTNLQSVSVRGSLLSAGFGIADHSDNCSLVSLASAQDHVFPNNNHTIDTANETARIFLYEPLTNKGRVHDNNNNHTNFDISTESYTYFHWNIETALESICKRLYENNQQKSQVEKLNL